MAVEMRGLRTRGGPLLAMPTIGSSVRKIAVFDTNILFSGVGWKGKPFLCLELRAAA